MKKKPFDCVKMKHDIQQQIGKEMDGLTVEERRRKTEEWILSDPVLAHIWNNARRTGVSRGKTSP